MRPAYAGRCNDEDHRRLAPRRSSQSVDADQVAGQAGLPETFSDLLQVASTSFTTESGIGT